MESRNFPVNNLKLLASEKSVGRTLDYCGEKLPVEKLTENSFKGIDLAFFSAGKGRSKEFVHKAVNSGALVIDNSSAFRMDPEVPLVVPEINKEMIFKNNGIIANPNCSTIQMVVAINPLHKAAKISRVVVSTYQATSGAGTKGMRELIDQTRAWVNNESLQIQAFPTQIAFNLFPHVDMFLENGYTREEMKMANETRKIMDAPEMMISATCVRVPILRAHSEAVNIEFEEPMSVVKARELLNAAEGVELIEDLNTNRFPMPTDVTGKDDVAVGRIRQDISNPKCLELWLCGDQIRKGAALNAVQIAEEVVNQTVHAT